jgi:hypothetical protein
VKDSLSWLEAVGQEYLRQIEAESPVFLAELDISRERAAGLIQNLARWHSYLPWEMWAHACVTVVAVDIAREAAGDEHSFPPLFLGRLNIPDSTTVWEERFGKRIEALLAQYFPEDYQGFGPFRYVGPVYRHAGVPLPAVPQFARLLRSILSTYGPSFTREEYESSRQRVSGWAAPFLASEHGYQYARNAVRVLHQIDIGLIGESELDNIPGYRRGFWREINRELGPRETVEPTPARTVYDDPYLVLLPETGRLAIRFDPRGVKLRAFRLNGRAALYTEEYCESNEAPRIEIHHRPYTLDRWWSPGGSLGALFRATDGRFVAGEGAVPAASYYLVAHESIIPEQDTQPEEDQYLGDSDYRIWRVTLKPGIELHECGLRVTGSSVVPEIEFKRRDRHPLGRAVFETCLPELSLRHWDAHNAERFFIVVDDGSGPRYLQVPAGSNRLNVQVRCPSTGAIWIESRGLVRQESALPRLPFTIVPAGIRIDFCQPYFLLEEPAYAPIKLPNGWQVKSSCQRTDGTWQIRSGERTFEGLIESGQLSLPFSVRVPRLGLSIQGIEQIWWEDAGYSGTVKAVIEGPPGMSCALCLVDDRGVVRLTSTERLNRTGIRVLRAIEFRDALARACTGAGEFAVSVDQGAPIRSGRFFASADRIRNQFESLPDDSTPFKLPGLDAILRKVREMNTQEIPQLDCSFVHDDSPLREWLATRAYFAESFDGTRLSDNVSTYAGEEVRPICEWYQAAATCTLPGEPSCQLLAKRPTDLSAIPLERWRNKLHDAARRLDLLCKQSCLVQTWRLAIQQSLAEAPMTDLTRLPGGDELTEGARKYRLAMGMSTMRGKKQTLNNAIGSLERAHESGCELVGAIAAGLLELAYAHSERTDEITEILINQRVGAGLRLADISPWEGDHARPE